MRRAVRAFLLAGIVLVPFGHAQATPKPNVIVIMTDDQTVEQMRVLPTLGT